MPIAVIGTFADGSRSRLTHALETRYKPFDESVITVDKYGIVTAVAPGNTSLYAAYHDAEYTIPVVVKRPRGPMVDKLEPKSGPPGTILRLTGVHFGSTRDSGTITFNGILAEPLTWNDTVLSVAVAGNLRPGEITIIVTVHGAPSNGQDFTVVARGHGE